MGAIFAAPGVASILPESSRGAGVSNIALTGDASLDLRASGLLLVIAGCSLPATA